MPRNDAPDAAILLQKGCESSQTDGVAISFGKSAVLKCSAASVTNKVASWSSNGTNARWCRLPTQLALPLVQLEPALGAATTDFWWDGLGQSGEGDVVRGLGARSMSPEPLGLLLANVEPVWPSTLRLGAPTSQLGMAGRRGFTR